MDLGTLAEREGFLCRQCRQGQGVDRSQSSDARVQTLWEAILHR